MQVWGELIFLNNGDLNFLYYFSSNFCVTVNIRVFQSEILDLRSYNNLVQHESIQFILQKSLHPSGYQLVIMQVQPGRELHNRPTGGGGGGEGWLYIVCELE